MWVKESQFALLAVSFKDSAIMYRNHQVGFSRLDHQVGFSRLDHQVGFSRLDHQVGFSRLDHQVGFSRLRIRLSCIATTR